MKIAAILAVAGLAGIASAQISIVNNLPGTFTNIAGAPGATFIDSGDDTGHNIVTTIGNVAFPAGNVRISNNGNAHAFGAGTPGAGTGFTNAAIPLPGPGHASTFSTAAVGVMMAMWDDIIPTAAADSGIWWQQTSDTLIIQWHDQDSFGASGSGTIRFQLKVFNTGSGAALAQFIYDDVVFNDSTAPGNPNLGGSSTIGYSTQSPAAPGLNNVQWSFNTQSIQNGTVLTVVPAPGAVALLGLGGLIAGRRNRR
jgi:hypothetical protein